MAVQPPDVAPGWYPDPEQPHTQRYWDGHHWTDQRAPLVEEAPDETGVALEIPPRLIVAGLGALIALIGAFLPVADTEGSIPITGNSLIQHSEGILVIVFALAGALTAFQSQSGWRAYTFIAGAVVVGIAVLAGTNLPVEYRNAFSEAVAGKSSPGAGVWTVGVGGSLIALSAFIGVEPLGQSPDSGPGGGKRKWDRQRWDELMSGQSREEGSSDADESSAEENAEADDPVAQRVDVVLLEAKDKVPVVKIVRRAAGSGLRQAKDLVDAAPGPILCGLDRRTAEAVKAELEAASASVELQ